MNTILLVILIAMDLILVGAVMMAFRRRNQAEPIELLREIHEEQRLLKELRDSVRDELVSRHADMKNLYEKVATMATETEIGLKSSGSLLAHEVASVVADVTQQIQEPLAKAQKQRTVLSSVIQKSREERQILQKAIARAEQLARFFDKKIPYQEVLAEIEDKKYVDARFLLSKGLSTAQVAAELGMPESDVNLIASMA
ncbi:MAG TPA: hypothetical protein VFO10_29430 [Oligoflexus sp.]|uniref:hypothetical protein n=1 Tax=Oligoflexus sp. TaxID=1971216 RepID=UPI002D7F7E51|nr:hypothetical protein [Oligoflexus sp.]HET9241425.1 hypothetical protein [Oligoflexus sp.]